jgi:nanoRNase/pAp phosphatase (c-di-AMP/oligoRNAs hydrolase)
LLEQKATPFPVLMTMLRKTNGVIVASLRSRNGEALAVAEKLQGGGHANACGATLPRSVKTIPDAVDYLRRVLDPAGLRAAPLNSLENIFDSLDLKS